MGVVSGSGGRLKGHRHNAGLCPGNFGYAPIVRQPNRPRQGQEPERSPVTRWQANALLLLVALIWGSAFVAQNQAMAHLGPMAFTGTRFLLGALVVLPLAWYEQRRLRARQRTLSTRDAWQIAGLGFLLWLGAVLQQVGIQTTSVTNAALLTALYVPAVPLLGWLRTGQRPHALVWAAGLGCVLGTYLLSGAGPLGLNRGDVWVLASVLPWAVHVLLVGELAHRMEAPFTLACGQFALCAALSLLWASVAEPITLQGLQGAASAIAYTGVVSVGIGFTAQVVAQRYAAPADSAILLSSEVLFAGLFGYVLMGDRLHAAGWWGAAFIVASMLLAQWPALKLMRPGTRNKPGHNPA
jgi:drug/metabolite transporter (DMT)-like permease